MIISVLIKKDFKYLTGYLQTKVNNPRGTCWENPKHSRKWWLHRDNLGLFLPRWFIAQTDKNPSKTSAVYFSPDLPLKIHSPPPEMHDVKSVDTHTNTHTPLCDLPISSSLLLSFYTGKSRVALLFDLAEVRFHSHHESWADTGTIQGLLTCQSSHPQWQTGEAHDNASKVSILSSWLPELDAVQAAEVCWTADVLHCGCFTHFLGGELLALLEE